MGCACSSPAEDKDAEFTYYQPPTTALAIVPAQNKEEVIEEQEKPEEINTEVIQVSEETQPDWVEMIKTLDEKVVLSVDPTASKNEISQARIEILTNV